MSTIATPFRPDVVVGIRGPAFGKASSSPVGLEIADGIGIGLDGEGLVIGDNGESGTWTIKGPGQDNVTIRRDAQGTHVTRRDGDVVDMSNSVHRSTIVDRMDHTQDATIVHLPTLAGNMITYDSQQGHYQVNFRNGAVTVDEGTAPVERGIQYSDDSASVTNGVVLKKTDDGIDIDAGMAHATMTADGFVIAGPDGHRWVVTKKA